MTNVQPWPLVRAFIYLVICSSVLYSSAKYADAVEHRKLVCLFLEVYYIAEILISMFCTSFPKYLKSLKLMKLMIVLLCSDRVKESNLISLPKLCSNTTFQIHTCCESLDYFKVFSQILYPQMARFLTRIQCTNNSIRNIRVSALALQNFSKV